MGKLGVIEWTFATCAPLCVLLEHLFPRMRYALLGRENLLNFYYFLIKSSCSYLAVIVLLSLQQHYPAGGAVAEYPLLVQSAIVLLAIDFKQYLIHRLQHRWDLYWQFHKVHHAAEELTWAAFARTHPLDYFFVQLISNVALVLALGANPWAYMVGYTFPALIVASMIGHMNVDFPRGKLPWWSYVIATPNVHAEHHSSESRKASNFGEILVVWDVMFGTFRAPACTPRVFGVPDDDDFPGGVAAQLAVPFRRKRRPEVSPTTSG